MRQAARGTVEKGEKSDGHKQALHVLLWLSGIAVPFRLSIAGREGVDQVFQTVPAHNIDQTSP